MSTESSAQVFPTMTSSAQLFYWSALVAAGGPGGAAPRVFVGGLLLLRGLGGFLGLGFPGGGVAGSLGRPTLAATGHGPRRYRLGAQGGQEATDDLGWD